jgi:1-acyl-sn-glycerol-3-phosphate acyltransferase
MTDFDDIRPYEDSEVKPTIRRLLNDPELLEAVAAFRYPQLTQRIPWLIKPLVSFYLHHRLGSMTKIDQVQAHLETYVKRTLDTTTKGLTVAGLDNLDPEQNYLFVSNHRDITMDPACVNWSLYHHGFTTLRVAIGDNLLTKPYVSDLMRLNKAFIVNRSASSPREKLKAAKHLSHYIHHSVTEEQANIWIAQREGRAKDGRDITNRAVINMLSLNRPKKQEFGEYIAELKIVPVSISYEWDPCDSAKAHELYELESQGKYEKQEHEDVDSIAKGISGDKGRVHLTFGDVIGNNFADAEEVATEIERQIQNNYFILPSNLAAYIRLYGEEPEVSLARETFEPAQFAAAEEELTRRLHQIPKQEREIFLKGYANPVISKFSFNQHDTDLDSAVSS